MSCPRELVLLPRDFCSVPEQHHHPTIPNVCAAMLANHGEPSNPAHPHARTHAHACIQQPRLLASIPTHKTHTHVRTCKRGRAAGRMFLVLTFSTSECIGRTQTALSKRAFPETCCRNLRSRSSSGTSPTRILFNTSTKHCRNTRVSSAVDMTLGHDRLSKAHCTNSVDSTAVGAGRNPPP
jgi:hypothetical protein